MITLYELYWSHYCEKVRWALNFKQLPWKSVPINAFTKQEMRYFPPGPKGIRTVPMIHDTASNRVIYESSAIMRFLDDAYPDHPRLFPGDQKMADAVYAKLLELDSVVAIPARRLGYTQLMLECPSALAHIFLHDQWKGILAQPFIDRLASAVVGMLLVKRFDLHLSEDLGLYEKLEAYLLRLSLLVERRRFIIGRKFTAADIGLACQLRPLRIVPFFFEHPGLANLFRWQEAMFQNYGREKMLPYEIFVQNARTSRPPVRRYLHRHVRGARPFLTELFPTDGRAAAANDHMPIWSGNVLKIPYWYFRKIRQNKVRQTLATESIR